MMGREIRGKLDAAAARVKAPKAVVFAGAIALLAGRVFADNSDTQAELEKRFQEGTKLYAQKKYGEAHTRFLEACAVLHTANCPKNLALTEIELALWPEAAGHFRDWLDDPRNKTEAERPEIEKHYLDARAKCGELNFMKVPEGARVRIDGKLIGTTPITKAVFVTPGAHKIDAAWPLSVKSSDVNLPVGAAQDVEMKPDIVGTVPTASATGTAKPPDPPKTIEEKYRPTSGYVVPAVLAGLGLVGIGMGVGFNVGRANAESERDSLKIPGICGTPAAATCGAYTDRTDAVNANTTGAIVGYSVGGLLLAASVVTFLVWPSKVRTLTIAPNGLGVAVFGSF